MRPNKSLEEATQIYWQLCRAIKGRAPCAALSTGQAISGLVDLQLHTTKRHSLSRRAEELKLHLILGAQSRQPRRA